MATESGQSARRYDIEYFEGVNGLVGHHVSNKHEFARAENARCIEIGTIQKRAGQTVVGTKVGGGTFTTNNNYGLFFYDVPVVTNQGLYRLSEDTTAGKATLFYLNELGIVTSISLVFGGTGYTTGTPIPTTGGSGIGCTVNITAVSGVITNIILVGAGTGYRNGETLTVTTGGSNATFTITTSNEWTALTSKGADIKAGTMDSVTEGDNMYIVNYNDNNRYIKEDGVTVMDSTDTTGNLYNSPNAKKINYYKSRLYLANYKQEIPSLATVIAPGGTGYTTTAVPVSTTGGSGSGLTVTYTAVAGVITIINIVAEGVGYKNGDILTITGGGGNATFTLTTTVTVYKTTVLRSSFPLGIIALINGDNPSSLLLSTGTPTTTTEIFVNDVPTSPSSYNADTQTGSTKLEVTDTKYFYTATGAKEYEVYRGYSKVADITVTKIKETSIDVNYTFFGEFNVSGKRKFQSSDEIWIKGTYTGDKIFRWMNNASLTGRNVKEYDTFKLSGGDNDGITLLTNVGNIMLVANKNGMSSWNDYTLENFDLGIGCTSPNGSVKLMGSLYFVHYTGVYSTTGTTPIIISNKVQRYFTGATKPGLENCSAGKKSRSVFFAIGDVTLYNADYSVDNVLNDVCLEYNITTQNWYVHTNVKASHMATFLEYYDPDRLIILDKTGSKESKEFLLGDTDDGEEIFMRLDFNKITLPNSAYTYGGTQWENKQTVNSLMLESERGSAVKAFVSIAEATNEWYEIEGVSEKGIAILKITPKDGDRGTPTPCRLLQVSLRENSRQTPKLTRLAVTYVPGTEPAIIQ